jgi:hypothetical protein
MTFAKLSRRRLIEIFVRHRYFYNQGNNTMTTLSVIPIEKIAIIAASVKYLLGDHISSWLIYTAAGVYLVYRVLVRWVIGYIWHRSDGYDIETEWNKGKIPPSRVEIINWEEGINQAWASRGRGGEGMNFTIKISVDKKICVQCGKQGKGFYECQNAPGKYICQKCVMRNIDTNLRKRAEGGGNE